jgi:hypothetical protein
MIAPMFSTGLASAHVRCGSKGEIPELLAEVCFTPTSGRRAFMSTPPYWSDSNIRIPFQRASTPLGSLPVGRQR